ncbi:MAG: NapC/NirT family cytochrome c [Acidobacteriota bacterium]|nr:MAG: NapC/NirT family cytochrome c [Acidobacteriota bacterium]
MPPRVIRLLQHPLTLIGIAMTTTFAILIITMFVIQMLGYIGNPYIGILTYLVFPLFFVLGLVLIPIGVLRQRRRARRAQERGASAPRFPIVDFNSGHTRWLAFVVLVLTVINAVIVTTATVQGVHVMDTPEFCGSCHSVMQPEFTAYQNSPHSRVSCVACHIGPGADWFVKSKLSGAWQVVSTTLDLFPRPIPTPVHNLRPARDTCEQCHWPEKFVGDRLKVISEFEDDEENTELMTVVLLRVGGIEGRRAHGIHWHVARDIQVRYRSDESREMIYDVELTQPDGTVKVFNAPQEPEDEESLPWRVMDCVDCHNRPTHIYGLPKKEVAEAIKRGRISRELPFISRESVRALEQDYASHEEARERISAAITAFYGENFPELASSRADEIAEAGRVVGDIYSENVFPSMKVYWGTYPDHIGHEQSPGCFRCHDDEHATDAGETISQDCATCHSLLAWSESDPEILSSLNP